MMRYTSPFVLTIGALASAPLAAQVDTQKFGEWTLTGNSVQCFLSAAGATEAQSMTFYRRSDGYPNLRIDTGMSTGDHTADPIVALSINGDPWEIGGSVDDHDYLFDVLSSKDMANMLRGDSAEFSVDGKALAQFSLRGFLEGMMAYEACVEKLPSPVRIPPPQVLRSAPPQATDDGSSPSALPPPPVAPTWARPAVPKRQADWITFGDAKNEYGDGDVYFRLGIDRTGRVRSCTITRSSGNAALDAHTCRLMERRARFEPALDRDGKPTAGTFSHSVRWRVETTAPQPLGN